MAALLFVLTVYCTISTVWCANCGGWYKVTLYANKDFKGTSQTFNDNKCNNLSKTLVKQASSLKIEDGCVQIYKDSGCQSYLGTYGTDINVGRPSDQNFKGSQWQDAISSVGDCSCGGTFGLTLYEHKNYKGQQQVITRGVCENLEANMNDKVSSIKPTYGCVKTYKDPNCKVFLFKYSSDGNRGFTECEDLGGSDAQDAISSVGPC